MANFFDEEKYELWKLATLCKVRIKTEKTHRVLEFNQSQWLKSNVEFNIWKTYKLINNAVYSKTVENLRNIIDIKTREQQKILFKMDIKIKLHVSKNIWQ